MLISCLITLAYAIKIEQGCGKPTLFRGTEQFVSLEHDGYERDYLLHVPTNYEAAEETPLVLAFHSFTNSNLNIFYENGWGPVADEQSFIVVAPNGAANDGLKGRSWNAGGCSYQASCVKELTPWDSSYCYESCGDTCGTCDWCSC